MKRIILFVSCLLAAVLANAQSTSLEWAKNMGGYYGYSNGAKIALDISNNVYATGSFQGRIDFDPGAGTVYLTSAGNNDIYITKSDATGNLLWAKQFGGTLNDQGNSIAVDGSGNVYVTGSFSGTADFDPGAATYNLTSAGSTDIFIFKSDASGNFIWADKFGSTWDDYGSSVVIDGSGNVYTTGSFMGIVDFDPGAATYNLSTPGNNFYVFISKLNSSGNFVWAKQLGGSIAEGSSIAMDASGNIYTTGYFYFTVDFDPGAATYNLTSAGSQDIFISKLDASGNFVWAKQLGGTLYDHGISIKADGSGNVYTIGTFYGTGDFDPAAPIFSMTSAGSYDIFISKLNASGNFVWAKQLGAADGSEYGISISVDGSGNVFTTGNFGGTADFDPGAGTYNLIAASGQIFISRLDAAGNFVWAKQMGGTSHGSGHSIAVDGLGNVFTSGYFSGISDFDPDLSGVYNLTALGGNFAFISKLNPTGNFVWAKSFGAGAAAFGKSLAVDVSGNVYTTGYFFGIVDFDPGAGVFNLSTAASDLTGDVFVSKTDASGNFIWAKQLGGISYDYANSIAVDASGNVYTTGSFKGTADFDPGAGIFNLTASSTNSDIFVSKLNASGNFVWAKKLGSTSIEEAYSIAVDASGNVFTVGHYVPGTNAYQVYINKLDASGNLIWSKIYGGPSVDKGIAIKADASGNIYITGYFGDTMDFDPGAGTYNLTSAGNYDVFVSKLDGSGNFLWAVKMGGTNYDYGNSIAIDASGNVYTTGFFADTADFDPGATAYNLISAGNNDIFVSKLNATGNFVWAKRLGGTSNDYGNSIAVDGSGNVYSTGYFAGTADFDPGAGIFNFTSSNQDMFISKLDPAGNFTWAKQLGGTSDDRGNSIAVDASNNVYTTGYFYGTADFDPDAGTSYLTAFGNPDMFVHKMSQCTPPSAIITPTGPTTFCSGGSVVLNAPVAANRSYQWKKGANLISGATLSSYTATTGGSYRVIVTNTVTGCSKTTGSATVVTINTLPSATITPQGPTTFCAGGSVVLQANTGAGLTYKWKKGTNYISGATLSNYTATTGGNYKVQVTNSNGCSKTSAGVVVSVPCREGEIITSENIPIAIGIDFSVYPNPNSGEFTIKFSNPPTSPIQIELTDELGKVVRRFETNDKTVVIKESNLANGIYYLTARNKNEMVMKKISVMK